MKIPLLGGYALGSGISSFAQFEVLIGFIVNHLFNGGKMYAVENAIF